MAIIALASLEIVKLFRGRVANAIAKVMLPDVNTDAIARDFHSTGNDHRGPCRAAQESWSTFFIPLGTNEMHAAGSLGFAVARPAPVEIYLRGSTLATIGVDEMGRGRAFAYETKITKGFTGLKPAAYTAAADEPPMDYGVSPPDKSNTEVPLWRIPALPVSR